MNSITDAVFSSWELNLWVLIPAARDRSYLRTRLEATASASTAPAGPLTIRGVLCRIDNNSRRLDVAARRVRRLAVDRSHDSTPAANDGCATANPLRRTLHAALVWFAH